VVCAQRKTGALRVLHVDRQEQERLFKVFIAIRQVFDWLVPAQPEGRCGTISPGCVDSDSNDRAAGAGCHSSA